MQDCISLYKYGCTDSNGDFLSECEGLEPGSSKLRERLET